LISKSYSGPYVRIVIEVVSTDPNRSNMRDRLFLVKRDGRYYLTKEHTRTGLFAILIDLATEVDLRTKSGNPPINHPLAQSVVDEMQWIVADVDLNQP
jgi:hypothetical protein